jgi:diphthamide biosynthesis protein 3
MSGLDENIYDVIEIEDLDFNKNNMTFYYPCPCGDKFAITLVSISI